MMLQVLLISIVIPSTQPLPGRRLAALEHLNPEWERSASARIANDGSDVIDWVEKKTLDVWDSRRGKRLLFENVFGCYTNRGKALVLTDSQAGHLRGAFHRLFGFPYGTVLARGAGCYLMAVGDGTADTEKVIVAVRPESRGLHANTVLFRLGQGLARPEDDWSFADSKTAVVACRDRGGVRVVEIGRLDTRNPVLLKTSYWPPKNAPLRLMEVDPVGLRGIYLNRMGDAFIASLRGGNAKALGLPKPMNGPGGRNPGVLRFVAGHILATYWAAQPLHGGESYLSKPGGKWKPLGPVELVGMSFDKKLVILQGADGIWLYPVAKL